MGREMPRNFGVLSRYQTLTTYPIMNSNNHDITNNLQFKKKELSYYSIQSLVNYMKHNYHYII